MPPAAIERNPVAAIHSNTKNTSGVIQEVWRLTLTLCSVVFLRTFWINIFSWKLHCINRDRLPCSHQLSPATLHVTEPAYLSWLWETTGIETGSRYSNRFGGEQSFCEILKSLTRQALEGARGYYAARSLFVALMTVFAPKYKQWL